MGSNLGRSSFELRSDEGRRARAYGEHLEPVASLWPSIGWESERKRTNRVLSRRARPIDLVLFRPFPLPQNKASKLVSHQNQASWVYSTSVHRVPSSLGIIVRIPRPLLVLLPFLLVRFPPTPRSVVLRSHLQDLRGCWCVFTCLSAKISTERHEGWRVKKKRGQLGRTKRDERMNEKSKRGRLNLPSTGDDVPTIELVLEVLIDGHGR